MKSHSMSRWLVAGAFVGVAFAGQVFAQDKQAGTVAATAAVAVRSDQAQPAALSTGVSEVLKLLDAKVSKDVIKAYVESSPEAFNLTASDIVALKDHGATDDITTAMLKRGGESRTRAPQAGSDSVVAQSSSGPASRVVVAQQPLDPDSYDYFQQYYLMPRTVASVNERLGYVTMPYGYYPAPVGPYYSGFAQPRSFGMGRTFVPFTSRNGRFR